MAAYRDRRVLLLVVPILAFLLLSTSLYLNRQYVSRVVLPKLHLPLTASHDDATSTTVPTTLAIATAFKSPSEATQLRPTTPGLIAEQPLPTPIIADGAIVRAKLITKYVTSILDPNSTVLNRMQCPALNETRYAPLQGHTDFISGDARIEFFFALNLRNVVKLLPRLMGSIVEAIRFLGPERCILSIVEGNSLDGTADVLAAIGPFLEQLSIEYTFVHSDIDPKEGNRIEKLAMLRNLALEPLYNVTANRTASDATILFVNDVAACTEDILELALSRRRLGADMTCAMDWVFYGEQAGFYDVWISRTISGDSFFNIPGDGSWDEALNLFWNDEQALDAVRESRPFQVYSCWNGAVAFTADPILEGLRFRQSMEGHCFHGEPQNLCKDFWERGYGKLAVVPSVNLMYDDEQGARIKKLKGFVSDNVAQERGEDYDFDWAGPPKKVRCFSSFNNQSWKPWKLSKRSHSY